jgi:uncharacterized protein
MAAKDNGRGSRTPHPRLPQGVALRYIPVHPWNGSMRRRLPTILAAAGILACALGAGSTLTAADPVLRRPQEPARPLPYDERDVRVVAADGEMLAGTLVLPMGTGPFPAVVLIAGTGPQDRDASVAGHRPFLVLADHLVRRGVAVLRYDERGVGASGGSHAAATSLDLAADAASAVHWLRSQARVDAHRIGIIGHSEGGMVAPLAAADGHVAFVVLLAAPGVPIRELAPRQAAAMARAEGATAGQVASNVRMSSSIAALFAQELTPDELLARARSILEEGFAALHPSLRAREVERALAHYASPWAQFALRHDPGPHLAALRVPVLALNGRRDTQVDAATNLAAIEAALRRGGNNRADVRALPGLNHYFQTARTGAPSEYGHLSETFSPVALNAISDWIAALWTRR